MASVLTTRLSSKGQVIVPKEVRDRHGWGPGTELVVEDRGGVVTLREAKPFAPTRHEDVFGCLKYDGPPVSVEGMDLGVPRAIDEEWR